MDGLPGSNWGEELHCRLQPGDKATWMLAQLNHSSTHGTTKQNKGSAEPNWKDGKSAGLGVHLYGIAGPETSPVLAASCLTAAIAFQSFKKRSKPPV